MQQMKNTFDETTKLRFRDANDPQFIKLKFGPVHDNDSQYDIRAGMPITDHRTFIEKTSQSSLHKNAVGIKGVQHAGEKKKTQQVKKTAVRIRGTLD